MTLTVLCLAGSLFVLPAAWADGRDEHDHERARRAVQSGEVLPLQVVLDRLGPAHAGQVLDVELEHEDGAWVYELRILKADGQLIKIEVDAKTAAVLRLKSRQRHRSDADHPRK